jgi:DNA-binding MarR family transcriptional regulator
MHIVSQAGGARQSSAYSIERASPYLLNRLAERMNAELAAILRPFGLSLRHWRVLAFLAPAGPVPIVALARDALIPHSTLSRLLGRMEKSGTVRRSNGARDLRLAEYALTAKGQRLYRGALPSVIALNKTLLAGISRPQHRVLSRQLSHMLANLEKKP